jgi:hypothetical protein
MVAKRKTAALENNGKRSREVFAAQAKDDFKALFDRLVASTLNANDLLDVFSNTGLMLPIMIVQNILADRYSKFADNSGEAAAIARGEAACASGKAPDPKVFKNRNLANGR